MATLIPSSTETLPELVRHYKALSKGVVSFDAYNKMVHTYHSTAIEGSSLTLQETQSLVEENLIVSSKPLAHHHMVIDHQRAQQQVLIWADEREPMNRARLQEIAAAVMRQTGGPTNTLLGTFDSSLGEFRTVSAIAGSRISMDARKVPAAVDTLLKGINTSLSLVKTIRQIYDLSFQTHYQLVSIHPFGDGNGRTSRLLMNYIQQYHGLPLSLIYSQDRTDYIRSLEDSRRQETLKPISDFMHVQLIKFLLEEIERLTKLKLQMTDDGF